MKNKILSHASIAFIAISLFFFSCQSQEKKVENAQENVQEAEQDLNQQQGEAKVQNENAVFSEEWKVYKAEADLKIAKNEERIAELRAKMDKSGEAKDNRLKERIDKLTQENNEIKARLNAYNQEQGNWEQFRTEMNHDMDQLGNSLNDFGKDNKK